MHEEVKQKLPNKPSALIRIALKDLELCENDGRYCVTMDECWHEPTFNGKCNVCLAGSVMAQTLKMPITRLLFTEDLDEEENKLIALDCFRQGDIDSGLTELSMNISDYKIDSCRRIISYHDNPKLFKSQLLALADDLAKEGL